MSNVVLFENNQARYLQSVNTPEYVDNPNALINPDLTNVSGVPIKHWKRDGDSVVEMNQAEKDALAQDQLTTRKSLANTYQIDIKTAITALVKVINLRLPSNKITQEEMVQALKDEII